MVKDAASGQALSRTAAFLAARLLSYSLLGLGAALFFGGMLTAPEAGLLLIRRLMGPLMLLGGAVLLGSLRPRLALHPALSTRLDRAGRRHGPQAGGRTLRAFLLGLAFSLSFCPTLFFLFFGLTVPLALSAPLAAAYPALFALGMTFPLLAVSAFLIGRGPAQAESLNRRSLQLNRVLTPLSGIVFLLTGLFGTSVYWVL